MFIDVYRQFPIFTLFIDGNNWRAIEPSFHRRTASPQEQCTWSQGIAASGGRFLGVVSGSASWCRLRPEFSWEKNGVKRLPLPENTLDVTNETAYFWGASPAACQRRPRWCFYVTTLCGWLQRCGPWMAMGCLDFGHVWTSCQWTSCQRWFVFLGTGWYWMHCFPMKIATKDWTSHRWPLSCTGSHTLGFWSQSSSRLIGWAWGLCCFYIMINNVYIYIYIHELSNKW